MKDIYTVKYGPIELDIPEASFQDAAWQAIFGGGASFPFSITNKRSGRTLAVIGVCPECCFYIWLDDNWFVSSQRDAIFEHCDCHDPGGAAYREKITEEGSQP